MKNNKIYLSIKNFFHNTNHCGREEVKEILKECVEEIIREELQRFFCSNNFRSMILNWYKSYRWEAENITSKQMIDATIAKIVKEQFLNSFDIKIEKKT